MESAGDTEEKCGYKSEKPENVDDRKKDIPENPGTSASSTEERKFVLNTGDIVAHLVQEKLAGEDSGKLAYEFHRALAEQILAACEAAEQETGIKKWH